MLTFNDTERTGDCSFGYVGTPLVETYGTIKPRGGLAVKKSFTRTTSTKSGRINGIYLETNISSVLLKSPADTTTCEWIAISDGIPESPMSARGDSGGLLVDEGNSIVGMIIGGVRKSDVQVNGEVRLVDNISVLTSADELLEWIKADVGRDVGFMG